MSRKVELGRERWTSFASSCSSTAVQRTLSLWLRPAHQLKQQLRSALVAGQWQGDTTLTLPLFWRRSTVSPVFFGRYPHSSLSLSRPLSPLSPSLISHLASVDVKQNGPKEVVTSVRWTSVDRLLLSCCFTSTEATYGLSGTGTVRDRVPVNNSSLRSDPWRPKRPSAIATTTMLRRWGPRQCQATCVLRWLPFQQCAEQRHKDSVRKVIVEEQVEQPCGKTIHPALRA